MTSHRPFGIDIDHRSGTLTFRVSGDLDYDTSGDLLHAVVERLAQHPPPHVVRLDFARLTWIDSMGLSTLLMAHRHATAVGAVLRLDNRPEVLDRMLTLTQTLEHLTVAGGRDPDGGAMTDAARSR
ncbi:STAS domain-containing protein [Streptomyces sp. NPDC016309]|uniref:STAS domain-containing protein n=1 Tax=Streptomyces sp. NPDC016309 TaxID=3364965 RepID=UPI0036F6CE46